MATTGFLLGGQSVIKLDIGDDLVNRLKNSELYTLSR